MENEREIIQAIARNPSTYLLGYIVVELIKAQLFTKRRKADEEYEDRKICSLDYDLQSQFLSRLKVIERKVDELMSELRD